MTDRIKSGQEIINEFLDEIVNLEGVNKDIASTIVNLYREGKLSNTYLINELASIREDELNGKD